MGEAREAERLPRALDGDVLGSRTLGTHVGTRREFVPFARNGMPSGNAEVFADGFAGSTGPLPGTARHRPVGVTEGPDGSLYVSDDRGGRI